VVDEAGQEKNRFLVVDDYGSGGIWFIVLAVSAEQIRARLHNVKVYKPGERPSWMTLEFLDGVADRRTYDVDHLPQSAWLDRLRIGGSGDGENPAVN
jgi:hypothetical protein